MIDKEELARGSEDLGVPLDATALERFQVLATRLYEANRVQNLTRIPPDKFVERHAVDSLRALAALRREPVGCFVDIGCGPGFPGLALAIALPEVEALLLDSHAKALEFAARAAEALGLQRVRTLHARAEEAAHSPIHRERYDLALCRAVASYPAVLEMACGFVRVGGWFVPHRTSADSGFSPGETGFEQIRVERCGDLRLPALAKTRRAANNLPRPWPVLKKL